MMSDLINRQDAIYALTEANLKSRMDSVRGGQENRSAIRIIMELPSAECNRGEWIVLYDEDSPQDGMWKCSICNYIRLIDDISPTNFCPNCGADMRGEEDEIQGKK